MLGMRFKVDSIVMSWHEVGVVRDGTISSRQDRMPTKLSSKFDNILALRLQLFQQAQCLSDQDL